jgi:branched-chain amino acid aminotransferase
MEYYNSETILFLDGNFVKASEAKTDLFGQTLHYGYGVFEGIRAYETMNGTKLFKAHEHFERLKRSCKLMGIPFEYSTEEMVQATYQVLERNSLSNAYIQMLRGLNLLKRFTVYSTTCRSIDKISINRDR